MALVPPLSRDYAALLACAGDPAMFRRLLICVVLVVSAGSVAAQTGPQLATVFPPGAKAGEIVEVTVSGAGFDGGEQLLFSDKTVKAELVPGSAGPDPK